MVGRGGGVDRAPFDAGDEVGALGPRVADHSEAASPHSTPPAITTLPKSTRLQGAADMRRARMWARGGRKSCHAALRIGTEALDGHWYRLVTQNNIMSTGHPEIAQGDLRKEAGMLKSAR